MNTNNQYKYTFVCIVFCFTYFINAIGQNKLQGYIYDENNNPLQGATILLNNDLGEITDSIGKFAFVNISASNYEILISAIGYKEKKLLLRADSVFEDITVYLSPQIQELEEVKVNANVTEQTKRSESFSIQLIEEEFMKEAKAASLMKTLNKIPGVNSMDVGTGISKPMIRGMGFYRVVVAQNGIKQEGQQWSNHHGFSIDQQAVSHVEIIKGASSLQYGSDAIGGVINILPPHVPLKSGVNGEIAFCGKSNTQGLGSSATISVRKGDVYSHLTLTYNSNADIRIPETDSFLLPAPDTAVEASHKVVLGNSLLNTAGKEKALSFSAGIVKPWGNSYLEFNYVGSLLGFFDWQGMQNDSIRNAHKKSNRDMQLPYQKADNISIFHFTNRFFGDDKLEIALGMQKNTSKEFSFLTDRTGNRKEDYNYFKSRGNFDLGLDLLTLSGNVFYTFKGIKNQIIKIGLNSQYQTHTFDGYSHILPQYNRFSTGVFISHKYSISKKWIINSGARIDITSFKMDETLNPDVEDGDSIFNPDFENRYPGTAFSVGCNYLPNSSTIIKINAGKSYRVPSAYELGAYGLHRHEGRFEKGNISNKPEQVWQLECSYEKKHNGFSFNINPFLYYFSSYLYLKPTPKLRREGQVYEYNQIKAMLSGGELAIDWLIKKKLLIKTGLEYVYAVNLDAKTALPFTPPFNIVTEVSYNFNDYKLFTKNKIGLEVLSVASQKYTVINELTTPGYNTVNIFSLSEIHIGKQTIKLMFKVKNLLNSKYYNHLSFYRRLRIYEPARDVQLFLSLPF
ncbi:MAG: TonB-dependent receptor [Bacteroidales bacterium]|nr:TonB-dependent receptor [Bacteroidales bacterium]